MAYSIPMADYKYPLSSSPSLATKHLFVFILLTLSLLLLCTSSGLLSRPLLVALSFPPPLKMFQAFSFTDNKQGIVSVLSSDSTPSSLRRTISADMSSHKWISQMKKVASSQEFGAWSEEKKETEAETETDVWGSVLKSQKVSSGSCNEVIAAPYVHPLVKRSPSFLSEKSLEICTESLGSETGSDRFSSYSSSEEGDSDDDEDENTHEETRMFALEDQWRPVKYSYKKSEPCRSFPPPLPSLSGPDGELLRMQPRRDNGRLVLEAMVVPSKNNFHAQRQDGRLVLTLVNRHPIQLVERDVESKKQPEQEEEEEDSKMAKSPQMAIGLLNSHRSLASMMSSKSIVLANRQHPSLPPRPKVAHPIIPCPTPRPPPSAVSLNTFEYFWRSRSGAAGNPPPLKNGSRKVMMWKNKRAKEEERMVVMCSNGSCKEVRRAAVVFWEPRCIATS